MAIRPVVARVASGRFLEVLMRKLILAVFILFLTSAALAQCPYPNGEVLGWGPGNGTFMVKYCRAFPLDGDQEMRFLGYRWTDRRPVNSAVFPLFQFSRGDAATLPWNYPDGTLVQALDSPVFLISNGRKSMVPDRERFSNCGFSSSAVMHVPRVELEHIPDGEPFPARACGETVRWVPAHAGSPVPPGAIETGRDTQGPNRGMPNYLCRAPHGNGMHPGKFINGTCNIAYGTQNIIKDDFEIAVGRGGEWGRGGVAGALAGGYEDGQLLYVCRARLTASVMSSNYAGPTQMQPRSYSYGDYGVHGGKLLPNGRCYITYGDANYWTTDYELFYERYERGYRDWDHDRDRDGDHDRDRDRQR
jgi:uncharacterized protein DUF3421